MIDIIGFTIWLGSVLLKKTIHLVAWILSSWQAITNKKLGDYFFSLGLGNDIYGNKLIAPHANRYWVKPGGHQYGGDEPISKPMARNKRDGFNLPEADRWERWINLIDRNHLQKTLDKMKETKTV